MKEDRSIPFEAQAAGAASLMRALSHEHRLLVLCHLVTAGELSVGQLVQRIGGSQSAMSQHLAKLREEGLVATRKEAQTVFYRIGDPRAEQVLALLHDLFCPELGRETESLTLTGAHQ
jgi:DNA-binding transcriptional ArsR family regulator